MGNKFVIFVFIYCSVIINNTIYDLLSKVDLCVALTVESNAMLLLAPFCLLLHVQ